MTENKQLFDEHQKKINDVQIAKPGEDLGDIDLNEEFKDSDKSNDEKSQEFQFGDLDTSFESDGLIKKFLNDEEIEIKKSFNKDINEEEEIKFSKNAFEIISAEILKPIVKDAQGNKIKPDEKVENNKVTSRFYTSKLEIKVKDRPYKIHVAGIRWFVNGEMLNPSFRTDFVEKADLKYISEIQKLYWKVCDLLGFDKTQKNKDKILTKKQFIDSLVGLKVKLTELNGKFQKGKEQIAWSKLAISTIEK
jgi:hypothetical protein